jgi:succinoglycan biosynthesis protein ExoM
VATYLRPLSLERLLKSIARLDEPECGWDQVRLVVVDNDPCGSAREVLRQYVDKLPMESRYVVEPQPGHACARNRSVAEAIVDDSVFIQFIDDDEVVLPTWLVDMLRVQGTYGADFVCGAVRSEFEAVPAAWVTTSGAFRRRSLPTGTPLTEFNDGNLLGKVEALRQISSVPFCPELSLAGGADTLLSRTLVEGGARAVWSEESFATEIIPLTRCRLGYVAKRRLRVGSTDAYCHLRLNPRRRSQSWRIYKTVRALAVGLLRLAMVPYMWLRFGRGQGYRYLYLACFQFGRMLGYSGLIIYEYSRTSLYARVRSNFVRRAHG